MSHTGTSPALPKLKSPTIKSDRLSITVALKAKSVGNRTLAKEADSDCTQGGFPEEMVPTDEQEEIR